MAVNINIPSQVKTYANLAAFPATGALKTIYIAEDTNKTYRWTGSVYTEISASAAMTWGAIGGTLSNQTDLQSALDAKVPTSRTLTINGVTQDLSANRTFTISTGITIGSTAIASGVVGRVLFEGAGNVVQQSSSLFWDATNNRLGIGTETPATKLHIKAETTSTSAIIIENPSSGSVYLPTTTYVTGLNQTTAGSNNASYLLMAAGPGSGTPSQGPYFQLNGNLHTAYGGQRGYIQFTSGQVTSPTGNDGKIAFNCASSAIDFNTAGTNKLSIQNNGNVLINTTTDAGFKLDVNGTARVQDNLTVAKNQNTSTIISISNTNNTASSEVSYNLTSSNGTASFAKKSALGSVYKTISGNDAYIYNGTSGDISILNDTTGRIKFAAGASSTAQMTLFSTGNLGINTTTDAGYRLDVNGTARVQGPTGYSMTYDANGILNLYGTYSRLDLFNSAGSLRARLNNDGPNGTLTLYQNATGYIFLNGAQSGNNSYIATALSIGNQSAANASSILELTSTTKGFLPPRMTTTQKNAIASPAAGLMVYDTTLNVITYYNGTMWI